MVTAEAITNVRVWTVGRRAIVPKKNVPRHLPKTGTISQASFVQVTESAKALDCVHVTPCGLDPRIAPFPRKTRTRGPVL